MTQIGRTNSNWIEMKLLDEIKNIKSDAKALREFGMTLGIFFGLLSAFLWWKDKSSYPYFTALSIFFLFFGFAAPALLRPVQKAWMALALVMGAVMSRVLLCVIFYLVLTPIAWIAKIFGNRFLPGGPDPAQKTYWTPREKKQDDKENFENQF